MEGHRVERIGGVAAVVAQRDELAAEMLPEQFAVRGPAGKPRPAGRLGLNRRPGVPGDRRPRRGARSSGPPGGRPPGRPAVRADLARLVAGHVEHLDLARRAVGQVKLAAGAESQGDDLAQIVQDLGDPLSIGREEAEPLVLMPDPDPAGAVHGQGLRQGDRELAAGLAAELVEAAHLAGQGVGHEQLLARHGHRPQRLAHQLGVGRRRTGRDELLRPFVELDVARLVADLAERLVLAVGLGEPLELLLVVPGWGGPAAHRTVDRRLVDRDGIRRAVRVAVADLVAGFVDRVALGIPLLEVGPGLVPAVGRVDRPGRIDCDGKQARGGVGLRRRRPAAVADGPHILVRRAIQDHADLVLSGPGGPAELILAVPGGGVRSGGQVLLRPQHLHQPVLGIIHARAASAGLASSKETLAAALFGPGAPRPARPRHTWPVESRGSREARHRARLEMAFEAWLRAGQL